MKQIYKQILSGLSLAVILGVPSIMSAGEYEPVEYGTTYSITKDNPANLTIDIQTSGVLTVKQKGTSDSFLFSNPNPASAEESITSNNYSYDDFDGLYILTYDLMPGTYYYDTDFNFFPTRAILTFDASDQTDISIMNGVPFTAGTSNTIATYTPAASGMLTVSTNSSVNIYNTNPFLFTSPFYTQEITPESSQETADGYSYKFSVTAATTYYFHYEGEDVEFNFTLAEGEMPDINVTVTMVDPLPGNAFNTINYYDGAQVIFDPRGVSWDRVEFSYTPTGASSPVVKEVPGCQILGGALRLNIASLYEEALNEVEDGTYCTVTVYGVNYKGAPLNNSKVTGAEVENGNLSIDYMFAHAPELVSYSVPDPFYAYWPEGDSRGKAVFTFSQDIKKAEDASIIFARIVPNAPSGGDEPPVSFSVAPQIEGNTVTYDLTGQSFQGNGNTITFYVSSFTSVAGLEARCGEYGPNFLEYVTFKNESAEGEEPGGDIPGTDDPNGTMGDGQNIGTLRDYSAFLNGSVQLTWDFTMLHKVNDLYATLSSGEGEPKIINSVYLITDDPEIDHEPGVMPLADDDNLDEAGNVLVIFLDEFNAPKGDYTLTVPAGLVANEAGEYNPQQIFVIHIADIADQATLTPEPNSTVDVAQDAVISIVWEDYDSAEHNENSFNISAVSSEDSVVLNFGNEVTIEDNALLINVGSLADGRYEFTVPEAYVVFNDGEAFNGELYATYTITSDAAVTGIEADENGIYKVYDINGVNVLNASDREQLGNLNKGLYIINGEKVIVR